MVARGIRPDAVTDQTSAHDPANGYLPGRLERRQQWQDMRERDPAAVAAAARIDGRHVEAMLAFQARGRTDLRLWQQHPPGSA